MNDKKENDLLAAGLRQLGIAAQVEIAHNRKIPAELDALVDAFVSIRFPAGDTIQVCVEIKRTLRPAHLAEIEHLREKCRGQSPSAKFLLVSSAVSEPLAQELRNRKIWFVDMAGNVYVELPGQLLLFVAGLKPAQLETRAASKKLGEQAARVLFQFLRHGPEVQATYRDLVRATGVSLGMISKLVTHWRDEGLIRRAGKGTHMVLQPTTALEMWCDVYTEQLAPRLFIGRYQSPYASDFASLLKQHKTPLPIVIGGEVAAEVLTGYLRAGELHLYISKDDAAHIRKQFRLAPSEAGNIELRRTFSTDLAGEDIAHGMPLAHPAFVYAELMAGGDDRLAETALRLRQEFLSWTL